MGKRKLAHFSPSRVVLLSFFFLIGLGTLLLALPIARTKAIPLIDLIFTATSATCITGLFTVSLADFTRFGHIVIMVLMQLGALGLATMSFFILSLFIDLGLATKLMAGQLLEFDAWQNIRRILFFIFIATFCIECIGTLCLLPSFLTAYGPDDAYFYAIFHTISSFCNAGISFLHDIGEQNLDQFNTNIPFLLTTGILMFSGGLGFITWREIALWVRKKFSGKKHRFSLQTKIILYGSSVLLVTTGVLFWILEHDNSLLGLGIPTTIANTFFHVASFKSCGFVTTDLANFHLATLLFALIIGIIGSAPGSTGSGIRITTFFIFINTIRAAIASEDSVNILGRRIPTDQIFKSIAIVSLSIGWILLTTFCLLVTEQGWDLLGLLYEVGTAFTNVGFSLEGTDKLSLIGKVFIIITMFIGRIGSLTLILGLRAIPQKKHTEFTYPEERVTLG